MSAPGVLPTEGGPFSRRVSVEETRDSGRRLVALAFHAGRKVHPLHLQSEIRLPVWPQRPQGENCKWPPVGGAQAAGGSKTSSLEQ